MRRPQIQASGGVRGETQELHAIATATHAQLLCAGAGWAGAVMPPAYGLGEVVKMVVVTAFIVFLPGLLVSVKPGPSAFVDGGGVLQFVPGESSDRRRSKQDASTGEY